MFSRPFLLFTLLLSFITCCFVSCDKPSNGSFHVAVDPLWYPLNFKQKENNVMGFSSELLTTISEEENINISLINTNWDTLFHGLKVDAYQGVLSSLQPYNFNQSEYDFSDLYLPLGPVLILQTKAPYKSLKDMGTKEVGAIFEIGRAHD